ncbi:MAG: hypothetical protein OXM55_02850 [Bdellovibrionales bacterium]|nr:hypothetical protein [Bdellovibrionales bacterium]
MINWLVEGFELLLTGLTEAILLIDFSCFETTNLVSAEPIFNN